MKCELVSRTVGVGSYKRLNNEEVVAAIARHGTIKDDNGKLVKYLMDKSHYSPLQHVSFGFKIETSRAISAQVFRHQSLEFQETSQRYSEILEFEDVELRSEHPTNRQSSTDKFNPSIMTVHLGRRGSQLDAYEKASVLVDEYLELGKDLYKALLVSGIAKECARMMLPMCSKTTIHVTGNLRNLLAFLNVRCDPHAQKEVRDIATLMGECLEKELPNIFGRLDWRNGMFM